MGIKKIIEKKLPKQFPKEFIEWRDEIIKVADYECPDKILVQEDGDVKFLLENAKKLILTIMRLTRQKCECEENCALYSLSKLKLNKCHQIKLEDLIKNDIYHELFAVNKKVVNGILMDIKLEVDVDKLQEELKEYTMKLCRGDERILNKLKCKSYEIRDHCRLEDHCYSKFADFILPINYEPCSNPNFRENLESIWNRVENSRLVISQDRVKRDLQELSPAVSGGYQVCVNPCIIILIIAIMSVYLPRRFKKVQFYLYYLS